MENRIRAAAVAVTSTALVALTYVPAQAYDWSMWPGSRRFNCYWLPAIC